MHPCNVCKGAKQILGTTCPRCAGRGTELETLTMPEPEVIEPANPEPAPAPKAKDKPAKKIELTEAELNERIEAARAADREAAMKQAEKDKAERERKEAESRGEFETLAQGEKARADAAEAKVKRLELGARLRDHLAEHRPEFIKAAAVIERLIDSDSADSDAAKAVRAAVETYEKTLPTPKGGSPQPAPQHRQAPAAQGKNGAPAFTGAAARF